VAFVNTRKRIGLVVGWLTLVIAAALAVATSLASTASLGGTRFLAAVMTVTAIAVAFTVGGQYRALWVVGAAGKEARLDLSDDWAVTDDGWPPTSG
jgi:hypothetical protein